MQWDSGNESSELTLDGSQLGFNWLVHLLLRRLPAIVPSQSAIVTQRPVAGVDRVDSGIHLNCRLSSRMSSDVLRWSLAAEVGLNVVQCRVEKDCTAPICMRCPRQVICLVLRCSRLCGCVGQRPSGMETAREIVVLSSPGITLKSKLTAR